MNPLIRIDTSLLYPRFAERLQKLINALGAKFYVTSGFRGEKEQNALYEQGRSSPGAKVTNARFGQSAHNFGCAADLTHDSDPAKPLLQPDWVRANYSILAVEAPKVGLESGFNWKFPDAPHIQLPLSRHGITFPMLKAEYDRGGMPAVWRFLDTFNL